jgi:hypothetical protein
MKNIKTTLLTIRVLLALLLFGLCGLGYVIELTPVQGLVYLPLAMVALLGIGALIEQAYQASRPEVLKAKVVDLNTHSSCRLCDTLGLNKAA